MSEHKNIFGNAAMGYGSGEACWWMDLHTDEEWEIEGSTIWGVIPTKVFDDSAVIVHTNRDGEFEIAELVVGEEILFLYKELHGLVPRHIAETLVRDNAISEEYTEWVKENGLDGYVSGKPPILFWEFHSEH